MGPDHKSTVIEVPNKYPTTYIVCGEDEGSQPHSPGQPTNSGSGPNTGSGNQGAANVGRAGAQVEPGGTTSGSDIGGGGGPVTSANTDTGDKGGDQPVDPDVEHTWADGPMEAGVIRKASDAIPVGAERTVEFTVQVAKGKHGTHLLWHRRLAHPGNDSIAACAKRGKIVGLTESQVRSMGKHMQMCNTCVETRQTRARFRKKSKRKMRAPNELIVVDIVGPFVEIAGFKYFLTVVDAYSRRNWIFMMKSKAEAFEIIRTHCAFMERQRGNKVRTIRSDNGGEFTSNEAKAWARANGIEWQYTTPYTSIQNGIAERMNRTIQDKARAIMHASGVVSGMWPSAMHAASYIINHLPTKALGGKIPQERWEGKEVDISHFRVWGCVAWIKVHDQQRTNGKLSDRGLRGMFIGYAEDRKAWMILTPSHPTKKIHYSRDVRFDEGTRFVDTVLSEKNPLMPSALSYEDMLEMEWNDKVAPDVAVIDTEIPQSRHDAQAPIHDSLGSDTGWNEVDAPKASTPMTPPTSPSLLDLGMLLSPREFLATPLPDTSLRIPSTTPTPSPSPVPSLRPPDPPAVPPAPHMGRNQREGPMTARELRAEKLHLARHGRPRSPGFFALSVSLQESEDLRLSADGQELEPATYWEAKKRRDWDKWSKAMDEQMNALVGMHTWDLVELPAGRKAIGSRWVYKLKLNEDGMADRWKARLVAQGFTQVAGVDYFETFAPVARLDSLRVILALAAHFGWVIHQVDVVTAYLNGDLEEEVYIRQPPGYEKKGPNRNLVCRLRLPLYGLKQSGRQWNTKFHKQLIKRGYVQCKSEPCVYVRRIGGSIRIALIYVDDVLIVAPTEAEVAVEKDWLKATFDVTDGGPLRHFLGLKITREGNKIIMSQRSYIKAVLERFNLSFEKPASTPTMDKAPQRAPVDYEPSRDAIRLFAAMVGCLKWIAQTIRPDLMFACGVLSRFQARPMPEHMDAAKRTMRFLRKTADEDLVYQPGTDSIPRLAGFADADFAGDTETSRSTTGFVFYIHGNPISWASRLQVSVSMSTVEAEYIALAEGLREGLWLRNLLSELGYPAQVPFELHTDNEGTRSIADNPEAHKRTKHIALHYHAVRERVNQGEIAVVRVNTDDNPADVSTKHLPGPKLREARLKLHVAALE
ncbi:hypothetical protein CF319_g7952 [Tilletia indica]|nr:hypothetical protein CF319_g7952 [Tilletia indica]